MAGTEVGGAALRGDTDLMAAAGTGTGTAGLGAASNKIGTVRLERDAPSPPGPLLCPSEAACTCLLYSFCWHL